MDYWTPPGVMAALGLATLLAVVAIARRFVLGGRAVVVPDALVAGALGLVLGPSVATVVPFDQGALEVFVYHGFALVFIAIGLQSPPPGASTAAAKTLAVAFPLIAIVQALIGLTVVLVWGALGRALHPGFGFMLTLGFNQGPGQALSLGAAWEAQGMVGGAQIGLVYAAMGFATCIAVGLPLLWWGQRRGLIADRRGMEGASSGPEPTAPARAKPGAMETLTKQVVFVLGVYALTFAVLYALTYPLPQGSSLRPTLWGFHFITGAIVAITVRKFMVRAKIPSPVDNDMMGRVASLAVDFTTVAALSAVQPGAVGKFIVPIGIMVVAGAAATLGISVWLGRRAFKEARFEHGVMLFGATTGTIPTGLALLRALDPELRGPVPKNVILGAAASVPLSIPLFLVLMPLGVADWPEAYPGRTLIVGAGLVVYLVALVGVLRFGRR